jgi:hypothetical protein
LPFLALLPASTLPGSTLAIAGAATHHEACDAPHGAFDDAVTFISGASASAQSASFELDNLPPEAGGVDDVTLDARGLESVGAGSSGSSCSCPLPNPTAPAGFFLGVNPWINSNNVWVTGTNLSAVNPLTTQGWKVSELNAAGCHFQRGGDFGISKSCTGVHLDVNYQEFSGSWGHFVAGWLGPLIASGLFGASLRSEPDLLGALRTVLRPHRRGISVPSHYRNEAERVADALLVRPVFSF